MAAQVVVFNKKPTYLMPLNINDILAEKEKCHGLSLIVANSNLKDQSFILNYATMISEKITKKVHIILLFACYFCLILPFLSVFITILVLSLKKSYLNTSKTVIYPKEHYITFLSQRQHLLEDLKKLNLR